MSTGNIESAFPIPHDDSPGAYPAEPGPLWRVRLSEVLAGNQRRRPCHGRTTKTRR